MRILAIILLAYLAVGRVEADEWLDRYQNQKEEQRVQDREQRDQLYKRDREMEKYQQRHRENAQDQQIRSLINHYQLRRGY